jgi:arylsulfatase A-like enzyme
MKTSNIVLGLGGTFMAAATVQGDDKEIDRPNVILCMCDDLGWGDVGYNGNKIIKTPNLDKMASEGIRFDRFYAAAPVCSPTRASCLTGRHPYRTGVFFANTGILRPEEITMAEILKDQGYSTGHFGKWHLGTFTKTEKDANRGGDRHPELFNPPTLHGFDTYFSTESKVPTWDPMIVPEKFEGEENRHFGWNCVKDGQETKPYGTHYWTPEGKATENLEGDDSRVIMDRAIPFIEKSVKGKKPFLAVIWFHTPHLPCVAGPKYAEMYKDQGFQMQQYAGCITAMDEQMGRLRNKLKELGINDNTILWFTSDNGPEGQSHNAPGSAGKYKGRKRSLHEGGVRVPGIMVWPNKFRKPMVIDTPFVTSDYLPTVVDALGISMPEKSNRLDGVSMIPLLEGKEFKRPKPIGFASQRQRAFNDEKYKLYHTNGKSFELYDMEKDPYEKTNIAEQKPEVVENFRKGFGEWFDSCRESFEGKEYGTASLERVKQTWPSAKRKKKKKGKK